MSFSSLFLGLLLSRSSFAEPATEPQDNNNQPATAVTTNTVTETNTAPSANPETAPNTETVTSTETAPAVETTPATDAAPSTETNAATTTETSTAQPTEEAPAVSMKPPEAPKKDAHEEGGHVAGQFTIDAMWEASSTPVRTVLLTLLLMMLACIFVGIERLIALRSSNTQSIALRTSIETLFKDSTFQEKSLVEQLRELKSSTDSNEPSYLKSIMGAGIAEFSARQDTYGIEAVERALEKVIAVETKALGKGMNILATTGATAPFVGLVGTIFGIINAFSQIGSSGGGDLMTLAPAIGEALITTAFGIIVALVGVWIFNYFTGFTDIIVSQMSVQSQSFIDWCYKRSAPPIENSNH